MASSVTPPTNGHLPQGLPPVKPPSARFIVQLFLIPGLIVAGLVFVFVFGGLAYVGSNTPQSFIVQLDNPNPDVRWRAANELAQVLQRPESLELASNPDFALDIAVRLKKANEDLDLAEKAAQKELLTRTFPEIASRKLKQEEKARLQDEAALAAWRKLRPQRDFVIYLISCCGSFNLPVCVPVLSDIARMQDGAEKKGMALRKRSAVHALAVVGDKMNRHFFGKNPDSEIKVLTSQEKTAIIDKLVQEGSGTGERAIMARYASCLLQHTVPSGVDPVDKVLADCANDKDIFLRELVAMALNFWDGPQTEPTLVRLAKDKGEGERILVTADD